MRKVTMEEFMEAIKNMEHVAFASPMPWHGWTNTIDYWEGGGMEAQCWREADKSETYYLGEKAPDVPPNHQTPEGGNG